MNVTIIWIAICTYVSCVGLLLSALHCLNATGYAAALIFGLIAFGLVAPSQLQMTKPNLNLRKLRWRFSHALPFCFLLLAIFILAGGLLYAPNNYDALSYRFPRVLNWLDRGYWHWVDCFNSRINTRSNGFEWLMAPVMALSRSSRPVFLINYVCFLLMPGLLFQVFRFLGISRRVAWNWMWMIPMGSLYVLQAGSVANDSSAALFFLAALAFAFRAQKSGRFGDAALSLFSISLVSSAKTLNQPLVLPWLIVFWPSIGLLWKDKLRFAACALVALIISIVPGAALNQIYCGDWTGLSVEGGVRIAPKPIVAVAGNTIQLLAQNLTPPILPGAAQLETKLRAMIPEPLRSRLIESFEGRFAMDLGELQIEESAGLGFSVSVLTLIALLYYFAWLSSTENSGVQRSVPLKTKLVLAAVWFGFTVLMAKSSIAVMGRISASFYPLLIAPVLLLPSNEVLARRRWWVVCATFGAVLSMLVVILTPARPLWPAQTVLTTLAKKTGNPAVQRAEKVYQFYGQRADCLAPIKALIPAGTRVIGFISRGDDPETSLWIPFGSRAVRGITPRTDLSKRDFDYVVVNPDDFPHYWKTSFEKWLADNKASIVSSAKVDIKVKLGAVEWHLVKLPAADFFRFGR